MRIKDYESTSNVLLDDMVKTMLDMKRKDALKAKQALMEVPAEDASKEVYVLGQLVTTKFLSETDLNLEDIMKGKASS